MNEKEYERHFKNALSNFGGISDKDLDFQCLQCKHYHKDDECEAFPDGIPDDILDDEFIHDKIHPEQDNEIVFKKKE